MINPDKLLKLLANHKTRAGYRSQFRDLLGLTESHRGEMILDRDNRELEATDLSFGELAYVMLGRNYRERLRDLPNLQEAEGTVVGPSFFNNISAFKDTVSGLLDALVLEAYQNPQFIGDDVFEVKESRVNGGKSIGVMNDGNVSDDDLTMEAPYPTVGLKETYVNVPNNIRNGNVIQASELDFVYDRTDRIQAACSAAGDAVRRKKEVRQAKVALGITNNYARDGKTSNTYKTTAGDVPVNHVNSSTNELTDWNNIDAASQVLGQNTDPGTGFEINVDPPYDVLVMPQRYMKVSTIVRSTETESRNSSNTEIRRYENPLVKINLMRASYIWYNLLIASGVSTTNAPARWHMGNFKKAFKYRQIIPFEVRDAMISAEEQRRDIVLVKVAREIGVAWVMEPRYAYQGTKE